MIFCTLFNGLIQNSKNATQAKMFKLYPGLPEALSTLKPNKHNNEALIWNMGEQPRPNLKQRLTELI